MDLAKRIRTYFLGKSYYEEGNQKKTINNVSDTLITKILLGTLGCSVAQDTYVRKGLSYYNLTQKFGKSSFLELRNFAKSNKEEIQKVLSTLKPLYTPMKIIDMFFFELDFTL